MYAILVERSAWEKKQKLIHKNKKEVINQATIFKDDYYFLTSCWFMDFQNFLYDDIEMLILQFHQHGIIKRYESFAKLPPIPPQEDQPQILTLYMLSAGFIVWCVTVLLACLTFIGEFTFYYVNKYLKRPKIVKKIKKPLSKVLEIKEVKMKQTKKIIKEDLIVDDIETNC